MAKSGLRVKYTGIQLFIYMFLLSKFLFLEGWQTCRLSPVQTQVGFFNQLCLEVWPQTMHGKGKNMSLQYLQTKSK